MKKFTKEEFQILFFKNLIKKIVKSYTFEEKNFERMFDDKKILENAKLTKFNKLSEEDAGKLAEKFVKEMRKKGKSFEAILNDEKKLVEWILNELYPELK